MSTNPALQESFIQNGIREQSQRESCFMNSLKGALIDVKDQKYFSSLDLAKAYLHVKLFKVFAPVDSVHLHESS